MRGRTCAGVGRLSCRRPCLGCLVLLHPQHPYLQHCLADQVRRHQLPQPHQAALLPPPLHLPPGYLLIVLLPLLQALLPAAARLKAQKPSRRAEQSLTWLHDLILQSPEATGTAAAEVWTACQTSP